MKTARRYQVVELFKHVLTKNIMKAIENESSRSFPAEYLAVAIVSKDVALIKYALSKQTVDPQYWNSYESQRIGMETYQVLLQAFKDGSLRRDNAGFTSAKI
jgi:hypothetical protein